MDDKSSEANTEVTTERPIVLSKEEEALLALKSELPGYVVESLMTAGYDTLQVISKMNTSKNPGNSLEEVEQYISTECIDDPRFRRGITNHGTFKFLPGHRQRITDFVEKIRKSLDEEEKAKRLSLKRSISNAPSFKQKKTKSNTNFADKSTKPDDHLTQAKAVAVVRQQICKWQRNEKNPHHTKICDLKENEDFEVKSTALDDSSSNKFRVYVYCKLCKKNHTLGFKDGSALLSNYTRHVPKCIEGNKSTSKENTMHKFFVPKEITKANSKVTSSSSSSETTGTFTTKSQSPELQNTLDPFSQPSNLAPDVSPPKDKVSVIPESATSTEAVQSMNDSKSNVQVFRIPPPPHK